MMKRHRLIWKIYPYHLVVVVLSLLATAWFVSHAVRDFYQDNLIAELEGRARILAPTIEKWLADDKTFELDNLARRIREHTGTRLTVILKNGTVVVDSHSVPEKMENHLDRPEIIQAIRNQPAYEERFSSTINEEMLYLAVPLRKSNELVAFVRVAKPVTAIQSTLADIYGKILAIGALTLLIAAMFSFALARRITGPLRDIQAGAERIAAGDLRARLYVYDSEELATLSNAMNNMAAQLSWQIQRERKEKAEVTAVLASMVEGVVAIDGNDRILTMNQAAADMLAIDRSTAVGSLMQSKIRLPRLLELIEKTRAQNETIEHEIVIYATENKYFQIHATPLRSDDGEAFGVLLVMNDMTKVRKLENLRRQFVANVSHELRTPITAVQGALETILDGAIESRDDTVRFVKVALRHTVRFAHIIRDLLLLSRIEQEDSATISSQGELLSVNSLVAGAVALSKNEFKGDTGRVVVECPKNLHVRGNSTLLEQALMNLVNNALNYSEADEKVEISVMAENGKVLIQVKDHGIGIPAADVERIFERFYRVDKSRSRAGGGTGLGLAIVKHIVQAHRGRVWVESEPGQGSMFVIELAQVSL